MIATKGLEGLVDVLLDSAEYLDAFGYDTVPYQRNRVLPGRELGDTPFNITTCLLYTSPSPRDGLLSRMPSSA